jgi:glycosyltransferase involved in cell wall biosynthesis
VTQAPHSPRVSVIIPTFNRARDIGRCLDSLFAQTFRDFEVLVCDDGSKDDTGAIVAGYASRLDLKYRWAENFGGPARPRNDGVANARGQLLAFLDSDDWWAPGKLAASVLAIDSGADFVYHDLYLAARSQQRVFLRKSPTRDLVKPVVDDLLANGNGINNSSVVVRRDLMERIGGFTEDRSLIASEDYDAWVRVAKLTDRFVRIPQTLGYYWIGDGNISNPRRTISTHDALEARYASELAELRKTRPVFWLSYAKARSNYLIGADERALAGLAEVEASHAPLQWRAKSAWMRARIGWRLRRAGTS